MFDIFGSTIEPQILIDEIKSHRLALNKDMDRESDERFIALTVVGRLQGVQSNNICFGKNSQDEFRIILRKQYYHDSWNYKGVCFLDNEKSKAIKQELDDIMATHFGKIPKK